MNRIHPRGVGRKYDIIGKRNSSKLETASGDIDVFSTPIEVPYHMPNRWKREIDSSTRVRGPESK